MILDNILNSTSMCDVTYLIFDDMGASIGGTPEAFLLIYGIMFILLPIIGLTIARQPILGLLGGTAGHIGVIMMGAAGCLPMPVEYLISGSFIYIIIAGMFWYVYKNYKT